MTTKFNDWQKDANGQPTVRDGSIAFKTITYDGTTNKGALGTTNLFTVTGTAICTTIAYCKESLNSAGAGTLEVGTTPNSANIIAQTLATSIDAGQIFGQASSGTLFNFTMNTFRKIIVNDNIFQTVGTSAITDGEIEYICLYSILSLDGNVQPA